MDNELFLQITDTSLKIGLGALIAAVTAWVVLRRNAQQPAVSTRCFHLLKLGAFNLELPSRIET